MRGWSTGKQYTRTEVKSTVTCWEQPWWAWLRQAVFHRTVCRWFGRWTRRFDGWPHLACFEYTHAHRTVVHQFVIDTVEKT